MRFELRNGKFGSYFFDTLSGVEMSLQSVLDALNDADGTLYARRALWMSVGKLAAHLRTAQSELRCQVSRVMMHPQTLEELKSSSQSSAFESSDYVDVVCCSEFRGMEIIASSAVPAGFVRFVGINQKELQLPRFDP